MTSERTAPMAGHASRVILTISSLLIVSVSLFQYFGQNRANKLMGQVNAVVNEAWQFSKEVNGKYDQLRRDERLACVPGNLAQLSPLAQDTANLMPKRLSAECLDLTIRADKLQADNKDNFE